MSTVDSALLFDCLGESLLGVLSEPAHEASDVAVLVVVGGPQYRVGSHRLFVLLSRGLAARGYPCLRFDCRGMGDGSGAARSFEQFPDDIRAAIDCLFARIAGLRTVVLWGLCDGASAACLYAPQDSRVGGLVLLNPWVRTAAGQARTYLRHYYLQRLMSKDFWRKLLGGGWSPGRSLSGLGDAVSQARSGGGDVASSLPGRMAAGLREAGRPFLVVLSGRDYVAREFEAAAAGPAWTCLGGRSDAHLAAADHTFSNATHVAEVCRLTADWMDGQVRGRAD